MNKAKKEHWRNFVENATQKTIWQINKYASETDIDITTTRIPVLTHDQSKASTNQQKAEVFKKALFPLPPIASLNDIRDDYEYDNPMEDITVNEHETLAVIKDLPSYKAPGPSGVINETIKRFKNSLSPILTAITNACLKLGHYPKRWKHFTTVVIRKPGKDDYTAPKAYRPIALEETLGKVIESVIAKRLTALAEQHHLLSCFQFGARPGRTTTDAIFSVTQVIKDAQRRGEVMSVLFLDISQAFPNVNATRLIHNLKRKRIPRNLVHLIHSFLHDRDTQLSFDGHISDNFAASNGVPQGSPLSPVLYNFYAADLLDAIFDNPQDPQNPNAFPRDLGVSFVDDTAFAVSSPSFAENIAKLQAVMRRALVWADQHASQFDLKKFQLIHFLHELALKTREGHDLPLHIRDIRIQPTNSAKYLGVIIDRHLRWSMHVDYTVAKGIATVLALGRLVKSSFGLPLKYARQLYQAVVLPRIEYGAEVWYEPIRGGEGEGERRKGSVGSINKLGKVQRLASIIITGGLKTTSTKLLEYHAFIPPLDLHFNRKTYNAAVRISSLPPSHPLYNIWNRRTLPLRSLSPLQRLQQSFHDIPTTETIDPSLTDPSWTPPFKTIIRDNKEEAIRDITTTYRDHFKIFTDGSGYEERVGASAVAWDENGGRVVRKVHLGKISEHTVYEGEVTGIGLAADIIHEIRPQGKVAILTDNQAGILSIGKKHHASGQSLIIIAQESIVSAITSIPNLELTIGWVPGHCDVDGNEWADLEAKDAALGHGVIEPEQILGQSIPANVSALKAHAKNRLTDQWTRRWKKSKEGRTIAKFDKTPPSNCTRKLYHKCDRRDASLLTQLRSNHIPLASYLFCIKAIDSPLCQRCNVPETPEHFLLDCHRWNAQRRQLRTEIGRCPFNLTTLLANPDTIPSTLKFVHSTNRFPNMSRISRARNGANEQQ